jgi:cytochrome c oxidase subunit 2
MKMDAVPGTPTTMWFTPRFTTTQMKEKTGNPNFVYELSCDQMCGKGHTGMRGVVVVETQEEFDAWMAGKKPQYYVANPDKDPSKPKADTAIGAKPIAAVSINKGK